MQIFYIMTEGDSQVYHSMTFTTEALALQYASEWKDVTFKLGTWWEGDKVVARLRQARLCVE